MQNMMFHPGVNRDESDPVAKLLLKISQNTLVVVLGLLPLFFIPISYAPFAYTKILFVLVGVAVSILFFSLYVLREGVFTFSASFALMALWVLVGIYGVSALLSGDMKDALIGEVFSIHSAAFMLLLAVIATATMILRGSKTAVVRLYSLLIVSGSILALFHIARIIFGAGFLDLGIFTTLTTTPIGGWNGLALYFGLVLLIAVVAVEQLPLTKPGKIIIGMFSALALFMLMLVNYFAVWAVLAAVSIVVLIYSLTRKHYRKTAAAVSDGSDHSFMSTILTTIVLLVSLLFIFGGATLGTAFSEYTGVAYSEVRPSFSATVDIARGVYSENPIFGIGPNKFVDAWRLYKDVTINPTMFWDTNFDSGNGFITTAFATTGILGVLAWFLFFGLILWYGFKMLYSAAQVDRFWNFIATSSFIAAVYLWGMSAIYVPTGTILILAAMCVGVFLAAYSVYVPQRSYSLSVNTNRAYGILFVGVVVLVIFSSVGALYSVGRHYSALYSFNRTFATLGENIRLEDVQAQIAVAYDRSESDVFARQIAQYQLTQMNALLSLENPTEEQRQIFQDSVANAVNAARLATENDPTEALNWRILGQIYSALVLTGVEDAYDRAVEAFDRARALDPQNPAIVLLQAQLESRNNNMEQARILGEESVALKRNFTEALLFLSQIDIFENNVPSAIERTEAIISIEPNNPARYYQLGVLESSAGNSDRAIAAFERAVSLDNDYANARYFLALGYADQNRTEAALEQLRVVQELNPDNQEIAQMIARLENGESIAEAEADTSVLQTENTQTNTPALTEADLIPESGSGVTTSSTTTQTE